MGDGLQVNYRLDPQGRIGPQVEHSTRQGPLSPIHVSSKHGQPSTQGKVPFFKQCAPQAPNLGRHKHMCQLTQSAYFFVTFYVVCPSASKCEK